MFMKLVLTVLVIIGAVVALRLRKRPPARSAAAVYDKDNRLTVAVEPALPKIAAYAALAIMLLGCAVFIFFQWQDTWQVVTVRVINSGNGKELTYQAYKGDVGGRSFTTTDGRTVNLAEVERMELGGR